MVILVALNVYSPGKDTKPWKSKTKMVIIIKFKIKINIDQVYKLKKTL